MTEKTKFSMNLTRNSLVSKYVTMVVKLENRGARKTQTFLISIVIFKNRAKWYKAPDVTINPG